MKLRFLILAAPATLVAAISVLSCSSHPISTRTSDGGTAGSSTGGVSGGVGGTAGMSTGGVSGGVGGTAGTSTGGVSGGGGGGLGVGATSTGGMSGGGAGGSSGGSGGVVVLEPTFDTLKGIIQMSCFGGLCHDLPEHPLQLTVNDMLYTTLTTHVTENCGPVLTPGNPEQSALVRLIKGACNGTERMPFGDCYDDPVGGADCLAPEEIAAIEEWVASGASP